MFARTPAEGAQLREKLDILDGSRPRRTTAAAVRIADLEALLQLPATLKSKKAAGAAPTKAEYDALVDDVHQVHARLVQISNALQGKLLP